MPNHLHLLTEGLDEDSDLPRFVAVFKQHSGFQYGRPTSQTLWQPGYYDHVLRADSSELSATDGFSHYPVASSLKNVLRYRATSTSSPSRMQRVWIRRLP